MKKSKTAIIIIFILYALPIPLSLASWIGTIMALAAIGLEDWASVSAWVQAIAAGIAMLAAGTYLISYIISLIKTLKNKKLSKVSLLPLLHIIITILLLAVWFGLNTVYGT